MDGKKLIGFPDSEFYAESFEKKVVKRHEIFRRARYTLKILGVAINSHVISFQSFLIF